jgi:hypothetical protein
MVETWVSSCVIFLIVTFLAFRIFELDKKFIYPIGWWGGDSCQIRPQN